MLLIREEHEVIGLREDDFEATMRDEWLPALGGTDDARLLYYLDLAHGSGASYRVVTYTAVRDAAAWGHLVERVHRGDLASLVAKLDAQRHEVRAKQLVPLSWSPGQEVDFGEVPTQAHRHELSVFMEDTVWPFEGRFETYIERAGAQYATEFVEGSPERPRLLEIQAAYRAAWGSQRRREVVLWQKVLHPEHLARLIASQTPPQFKRPGRWMHDALALRDQWQSALLRTSSWSPLW